MRDAPRSRLVLIVSVLTSLAVLVGFGVLVGRRSGILRPGATHAPASSAPRPAVAGEAEQEARNTYDLSGGLPHEIRLCVEASYLDRTGEV